MVFRVEPLTRLTDIPFQGNVLPQSRLAAETPALAAIRRSLFCYVGFSVVSRCRRAWFEGRSIGLAWWIGRGTLAA